MSRLFLSSQGSSLVARLVVINSKMSKGKLTSRFHFEETFDSDLNASSELTQLLSDDTICAETLWKMYNKARDLLPYKARMENLTWRMMFINQPYMRRGGQRVEQGQVEQAEQVEQVGKQKKKKAARAKPKKNADDVPKDVVMNDENEEFDYIEHIRKMSKDDLERDDSKKRPANFSPMITSSTYPKLYSNLSASLAQMNDHSHVHSGANNSDNANVSVNDNHNHNHNHNHSKNNNSDNNNSQLMLELQEHENAFAFSLDSYEQPSATNTQFSDSLHSLGTVSLFSHNKSNGVSIAGPRHSTTDLQHMSTSMESASPMATIGPSSILGIQNGGYGSHLHRESSLVSLPDYNRSQNNTPFSQTPLQPQHHKFASISGSSGAMGRISHCLRIL